MYYKFRNTAHGETHDPAPRLKSSPRLDTLLPGQGVIIPAPAATPSLNSAARSASSVIPELKLHSIYRTTGGEGGGTAEIYELVKGASRAAEERIGKRFPLERAGRKEEDGKGSGDESNDKKVLSAALKDSSESRCSHRFMPDVLSTRGSWYHGSGSSIASSGKVADEEA